MKQMNTHTPQSFIKCLYFIVAFLMIFSGGMTLFMYASSEQQDVEAEILELEEEEIIEESEEEPEELDIAEESGQESETQLLETESEEFEELVSTEYYEREESGETVPEESEIAETEEIAAEELMAAESGNDDLMETVMSEDYYDRMAKGDEWEKYLLEQWQKSRAQFEWAQVTGIPVWDGTTANKAGDPVTEASAYPAFDAATGTYYIYSGQQLIYTLRQVRNNINITISLERDLDMNGAQYSMPEITGGTARDIRLHGNGHTIYNLGLYNVFFMSAIKNLQVTDLTFTAVKGVNRRTSSVTGMAVFSDIQYSVPLDGERKDQQVLFRNVHCIDSLIYAGWHPQLAVDEDEEVRLKPDGRFGEQVGFINRSLQHEERRTNPNSLRGEDIILIENCSMQNLHTFGGKHVGSMGGIWDNVVVRNSFAVDSVVVSTEEHSGGFVSCVNGDSYFQNCFTNNTVYGSLDTGVFIGNTMGGSIFENCYTSGTIEGMKNLGGFIGKAGPGYDKYGGKDTETTFENCYSTSIVGMQNGGECLGGFIGSIIQRGEERRGNPPVCEPIRFIRCYAAGEVGSADTDVSENRTTFTDVGGFYGDMQKDIIDYDVYSFEHCYYDKQTTAMREWAAGNKNLPTDGITGLLTTATAKAPGLTSGYLSADGSYMLPGMEDNAHWSYTDEPEELYPTLAVFSIAGPGYAGRFGIYEDMVIAYSVASASTIKLDTWEKRWDGTELPETTYDTVRDITAEFSFTLFTDNDGHWSGLGEEVTLDDGTYKVVELEDRDGTTWGTRIKPGMEWFTIEFEYGGETGNRRLRVIPTARLSVGGFMQITAGDTYNHGEAVRLAYTDAVGATSEPPVITQGKFPDTTEFSDVDMSHTGWTGSRMYVYLYKLKVDEHDKIIQDEPLWERGEEPDPELKKKWNGKIPFEPEDAGRYLAVYYWAGNSDRYLTDAKLIEVKDREYKVTIRAQNKNETPNRRSVFLDAFDYNTSYNFGSTTKAEDEYTAGHRTKATAAFKPLDDKVTLTKLTLRMGRTEVFEKSTENIAHGETITIPVTHYRIVYNNNDGSFSTKTCIIDKSYTLDVNSTGVYTLHFDEQSLTGGTPAKDKDGNIISPETLIDYADVEDDIEIILTVEDVRGVIMHIRQVVPLADQRKGLGVPAEGYVNMINADNSGGNFIPDPDEVFAVIIKSGGPDTAYTDVMLEAVAMHPYYLIQPVIPANYKLKEITGGTAADQQNTLTVPYNIKVEDEEEYYISIYLAPVSDSSDPPYSKHSVTNKIGSLAQQGS